MIAPSAPEPDLTYPLSGRVQLIFSNAVLRCFFVHRQLKPRDTEAGGQLFAKISPRRIVVCVATAPRPKDIRSRFGIKLDRRLEQKEIDEHFKDGLHYIGDWHTHPEPEPTPSSIDAANVADCFVKSKHELNSFLMVIVGQRPPPEGLWVGHYDGETLVRLEHRKQD